MSNSLSIPLLVACVIFAAPHVRSENQSAVQPVVEVTFRTFLLSGSFGDADPGIRKEEGSFFPVPTSGMNLSQAAVPYKGPNPIVFYLNGQVVGSVHIPDDMKEVILLFQEETAPQESEFRATAPRFRIIPVHADAEHFPRGSYLLFNFTDLDITADIDSNLTQLEPGDQKRVVLSYDRNTTIDARFAERRGGEWFRSYQLAWYFKPTVRSMVFLSRDDDVDRSLRLRTITDRPGR